MTFVEYLTEKGCKLNTNMHNDLKLLEEEGTLEWTLHYNKFDFLINEYKEYKKLIK